MRETVRTLLAAALAAAWCAAACAGRVDGSWKGTLDVGTAAMPLVLNFNDGVCTLDSPEQGVYGVETFVTHNSGDSLRMAMPAIRATLTGTVVNDTLRATFTQFGMPFRIAFTKVTSTRRRPQTPLPPYPYDTEDVRFHNIPGGATLAGTVTYPEGWNGTDSITAVVLVTGSGQQNRDEEVFGHKPFLVIADYLARHGVAALRYDDRGTGQSTGDPANATTEDFMGDAAAAVDFLRAHGPFRRVGVIGHSEGGTIAFMLAARGIPDFIVSMAGTAVRGDSALLLQNMPALDTVSIDIAQVRDAVMVQANPWLNFFINYSPVNDIRAARCPVLALGGSRDTQVNAKANIASVRNNLPHNPKSLAVIYPGLNHLFQNCKTGDIGEYVEIEETVSPEVLNDIAAWINGL